MPTTNPDQAPQGPRLEDAARVFEGLLNQESPEDSGNQDTQSNQAAEGAPVDTDEGVAAEAPSETASQEAEEAEAPKTEETPEAPPEKDPLYTVRVNGHDEQITLAEALAGYQRNSDYREKTASIANQRRELQEQAKAVSDERQQYATMLAALRDQLQTTQEAEPDWDDVYRTDPVGYARRRDEWRDKQEKKAAANFELQRVHALQQKEFEQHKAEAIRQGQEHMRKQEPAWRDPQKWDADRQALVQYALKSGYSAEEISNAYDPRALLWGHKARLWDELQAKQPKPVPTNGPRVASAGAAPDQQAATRRLNAAQQRLAKTGRLEDAAKVFEQMLR
jgi:hypothetical protein